MTFGGTMDINNKTPFTDVLALKYRAKMHPEEKITAEQDLGAGAVKFKLSKGGMRNLFAALDQQKNNVKGR